jgi:hypothetical protein
MISSNSFFVGVNGLFDFDLTFASEALLFLLLSGVVTFFFLTPISKQLDERAEFIEHALKKSIILVTFGYEKISNSVGILVEEMEELNRQIKLVKSFTNKKFEDEVDNLQKENGTILRKLKGDLTIQSAFVFSTLTTELNSVTEKFFIQKFQA